MSSYVSSSTESVSPYHSTSSLNEGSHNMLPMSHDHRPISDEFSNNNGTDRCVKVVFSCQTKSHPFQERYITLQDGIAHHIKIGRLVAKVKPSSTNAIFDCKVLSRNHAIMWLEDGKVWLKDTKSSNGTFVNSQRLAKNSEESDPREIVSGDIVQFGVEVVENQVAHDCIVAQIGIFDDSGFEIKKTEDCRDDLGVLPTHSQEQIFQITYYLSETLLREKALEEKVQTLAALLEDLQEEAKNTWRVILNEDRMLCKLESMQQQLDIYHGDYSSDSLQAIAAKAIEEKETVRTKTMEIYDALLLEKARALEKVGELYSATSDECLHIRLKCQELDNTCRQLNEEYQSKCRELLAMESKLHEVDDSHKKTIQTLIGDQDTILDRWRKDVSEMKVKMIDLQCERDHLMMQLETANSNTALKPRNEIVTEDHSCNTEDLCDLSINMVNKDEELIAVAEKEPLSFSANINHEVSRMDSIGTETDALVLHTTSASSQNDAFTGDGVLSQSTSTDSHLITPCQCGQEIASLVEMLRQYALSEENDGAQQIETSSMSPPLVELVELTKRMVASHISTRKQLHTLTVESTNSIAQMKEDCESYRLALESEQLNTRQWESISQVRLAELEEARKIIASMEIEKNDQNALFQFSHARCEQLEGMLLAEQTRCQDLELMLQSRPDTCSNFANTDPMVVVDQCTDTCTFDFESSGPSFNNMSCESADPTSSSTVLSETDSQILRNARLMSGLAAVPLMILVLAVMIPILMWLQSLNSEQVSK